MRNDYTAIQNNKTLNFYDIRERVDIPFYIDYTE